MKPRTPTNNAALRVGLLLAWAVVSFVPVFFARSLQQMVAGWPLNFWLAAQGCLLLYIGIVALYAWLRGRDADALDERLQDEEGTGG